MRGRALGPGRLEKRGATWVLIYTDETGERLRVSLSSDRRTAERLRTEVIRKRDMARAGLGSEAGQELLLAEVATDYLADLDSRVTRRHAKGVRERLGKVITRLGAVRVRDLRAMDMVRMRNELKAAGASNRTANLYVDALRAMLTWAVAAGLIAANPIAALKGLPCSRDHQVFRRRALTDAEIERFLAVAREEDEELAVIAPGRRVPQEPLWFAFLETGARYGEMTKATWGDLDQTRRTLVLRAENTKSRKQRAIPLGTELVERLITLRALHETVHGRLPNVEDRIFLSPEGLPWSWVTTNPMRILDRLLDRAGIAKIDTQGQKLDIHALRTTCGSRLARRGVPLVIAQRWLGHSDPKLTAAHYVSVDVEDLRAAAEKATLAPALKKEAR